jgi:short-subunit dehydrogenase
VRRRRVVPAGVPWWCPGTHRVRTINAGIGVGGAFATNPLADDLRVINLNVRSSVHLVKRCVRHMVDRGSGRILITSSIAAAQPGPVDATYAASKAFLLSFAPRRYATSCGTPA